MRKCNPVLSLHLCRRVRSNAVYMQTKQPVKCHRSHTQSAGVRGPSPLMSGCYVLIHPGGKCLTLSVLTCCTSRRCTSACSLILFTLFIPTPDVQHLAQPHLDQHTTSAATQANSWCQEQWTKGFMSSPRSDRSWCLIPVIPEWCFKLKESNKSTLTFASTHLWTNF